MLVFQAGKQIRKEQADSFDAWILNFLKRGDNMADDLKFLIKYWKKHKTCMFSVIMSAVFLVIMLLAAGLLERTDIRRELHTYYNADGAFDVEYLSVDSETLKLISESRTVESIGEAYCMGKIMSGDKSATVGSFKDEAAESLAHYPLLEGRLPRHEGEAAVTKDVLAAFFPSSKIGDTISLDIHSLNGGAARKSEYTLVGIFDSFSRAAFEDSSSAYGYDRFDPRVVISYEEASKVPDGYTNVMFTFYNGEKMALSDNEDMYPDEKELMHECFERGYSICGTGRAHGVQMVAMADDEEGIALSSKLRMVRTIAVFAAVISVISMLCSLSVAIKNRMQSFRLMRCIGYSKLRIIRLLLIEMPLFFLISALVGTAAGLLAYEIFYHIQVSVFGLLPYRGYYAEWTVSQKTMNPFFFPLAAAGITILASYAVVIAKLAGTLGVREGEKAHRHLFPAESVHAVIRRILSQRLTTVLQIISLSCLMFICTIGYLYCTPDGKGQSAVSQTSLNSDAGGRVYSVLEGIDLKKQGFDAFLEVMDKQLPPLYLAPHNPYGISQDALEKMKQAGAVRTYCWSDWFHLIFEADGSSNDTVNSNIIDEDYSAQLGAGSDALSALPCIIISDDLLAEFSDVYENSIDFDGAVWISIYGDGEEFAGEGEAYPVVSFMADSAGFYAEEYMKTEIQISDCIKIKPERIEENIIVSNVLSELKNYPGLFIISGSYAGGLGIYNSSYDKALISAGGDEKIVSSVVDSVISGGASIDSVTVFELRKKKIYDYINNYASIIFLFLLLAVIYMAGFFSVLKLRLRIKAPEFSLLRCLGLEKKKLTGHLAADSIWAPLAGSLISMLGIWSFSSIMNDKYMEYLSLVKRRDQLFNLPGREDELEAVRNSMRSLRNQYLLQEEMWVPDWAPPFLVLFFAVTLFGLAAVLIIQKKQKDAGLKDGLSGMNKG